eukprot:GHVS01018904.1.p1 GENE.GHVS01018904.1~~GHVS01018904.1.p1  ORF type:complete len:357 (+),score=96.24 GHVS01018904.1:165-1235(+)
MKIDLGCLFFLLVLLGCSSTLSYAKPNINVRPPHRTLQSSDNFYTELLAHLPATHAHSAQLRDEQARQQALHSLAPGFVDILEDSSLNPLDPLDALILEYKMEQAISDASPAELVELVDFLQRWEDLEDDSVEDDSVDRHHETTTTTTTPPATTTTTEAPPPAHVYSVVRPAGDVQLLPLKLEPVLPAKIAATAVKLLKVIAGFPDLPVAATNKLLPSLLPAFREAPVEEQLKEVPLSNPIDATREEVSDLPMSREELLALLLAPAKRRQLRQSHEVVGGYATGIKKAASHIIHAKEGNSQHQHGVHQLLNGVAEDVHDVELLTHLTDRLVQSRRSGEPDNERHHSSRRHATNKSS